MNIRNITKETFILMKYTKSILLLLRYFKKLGIVDYFYILKHDIIKLCFSYPGCVTVNRYIKLSFYHKYTVSRKCMNYFLRNSYSILYFSTSVGILTSEEIGKTKHSGFVLCAVYS